MHLVYRHENKAILHSFKNMLEMNEIQCFLKNEHSAATAHMGLSNFEAELWVLDSDDTAKAKSLVNEVTKDSPARPGWTCRNCGEKNDANFQVCWQCQAEFSGT